MKKSPECTPRQVFAAIACIATVSATSPARADPAVVHEFPVPRFALPVDRVGVPAMTGGICNAALPDPARPPEIRRVSSVVRPSLETEFYYEVDYWLVDSHPEDLGCPSPPVFPEHFHLIDVGTLSEGSHNFHVRGHLDGVEFANYQPLWGHVGHYQPGAHISGTWWSPEQSGRGINVTWGHSISSVSWTTHDADGQPAWVTLLTQRNYDFSEGAAIIPFEGTAITTTGPPLAPGAADIAAQPWGHIKFTYTGCGRATLEWDALDARIEDGVLDLKQLVVPIGIEPCDISARSVGLRARWVGQP